MSNINDRTPLLQNHVYNEGDNKYDVYDDDNDVNSTERQDKEDVSDCDLTDPSLSLTSSLANLTLGVLGAGQLTLPYALKGAGLYLGTFFIILLGVVAMYVLLLLTYCLRVTNSCSYGAMLEVALGKGTRRLANILVAIYAWAGGISFLVMISEVLEELREHWGWPDALNRQVLVSILVCVIVLPLSFCRSLDKLKFTSVVGAFCAVFITGVVLGTANWSSEGLADCPNAHYNNTGVSLKSEAEKEPPVLDLWPTSAIDCINSIPLVAFALNSAWCYGNVFSKMKNNHVQKRVYTLVYSSHFLILTNYLLLAIVAYYSYCSYTKDNILSNMGTSTIVIITKCCLVLQLNFCLPMRFHVTRGVVFDELTFLNSDFITSVPWRVRAVSMSVSAVIVGSALAIACAVDNLAVVICLTSAVCASFIIYIFPTLCYYKLKRLNGETVYLPILVFILGWFVFIGGVTTIFIQISLGEKVTGG